MSACCFVGASGSSAKALIGGGTGVHGCVGCSCDSVCLVIGENHSDTLRSTQTSLKYPPTQLQQLQGDMLTTKQLATTQGFHTLLCALVFASPPIDCACCNSSRILHTRLSIARASCIEADTTNFTLCHGSEEDGSHLAFTCPAFHNLRQHLIPLASTWKT